MDTETVTSAARYPLQVLKEDNPFTRALATLEDSGVLPDIEAEFANLCNRVVVADHKTVRDREELREIVRKACGFINLGLERLLEAHDGIDPRQAADMFVQ